MATNTCGEWNCTAEEYFADRERQSRSMLEVFRKSRRLYHGRFISGTIPDPEPSDAMRLGTLLHLAILEPERYRDSTIAAPECDRRTKEGKATWARFLEHANGRTVMSADEQLLVKSLADAVRDNQTAAHWLKQPGKREHSITWQDCETGLICKCRRDVVLDDVLVDLKTCRDASPEGFAKSAAALGYNRQAAWYMDGHKEVTGKLPHFLFIAICTQAPFEVACYELDADAIDLGRRQNRTALFALSDCIEHDDWQGPHEKQVTTLSLPRWANYSDWEITE